MYNLKIGIIITLEDLLEKGSAEIEQFGLDTCQINVWDSSLCTAENTQKVKKLLNGRISISSLWVGWPGPAIWNFTEGPLSLGLVPRQYREKRIESLKKGADFAEMLGVKDIVTHVGFIPENPSTLEYRETVIAVSEITHYCFRKGINFNFETGQETPVTLMRTIEDVGYKNMGVNLDPANLLLYGKANPVDAVDIYKDRIMGLHVKDGEYPTDGRHLGSELPVGKGRVNFPLLLEKLHNNKFSGALIIEREISGPQQKKDILEAKKFLVSLLEKF